MDIKADWRRKYRIQLETPRFLLRPLITEDVDWLTHLLSDAEVTRYLLEGAGSPERAKRAAETMVSLDLRACHFGLWAIQDKTTDLVHGWTELSKLRPWAGPSDEIALSYVLSPTSWGRGIATEAAGRLLRHAFDALRMDRVMAVILTDNEVSRRVLEKLGMRCIENPEPIEWEQFQFFHINAPISAELHPVDESSFEEG